MNYDIVICNNTMQFRVPQFIDVEDKIIGSLTLKQFFYILGAAGTAFLFFKFIPIKIVAFLLAAPVSGFFLALAFVKINERPFMDFAESFFSYLLRGKVYVWQQPKQNMADEDLAPLILETTKDSVVEKANRNKLHEIAFGLDVQKDNSQEESSK